MRPARQEKIRKEKIGASSFKKKWAKSGASSFLKAGPPPFCDQRKSFLNIRLGRFWPFFSSHLAFDFGLFEN